MYCKKLMNIVQHEESPKYNINKLVINYLDLFIKNKTTIKEKDNLNPYKFSIEENIPQETAIMTFIIGVKYKLFALRFFYNCYCGEQFEVHDVYQEIQCTCEDNIIPNESRDRLFLYFKLLERPAPCIWEGNPSSLPFDLLESMGVENENFTLADVDQLAGQETTNDLLSIRNSFYDKIRKEEY